MKYLLEVCLVATLAAGITPSIGEQSQALGGPALQKGISVQLAITTNAVPMPDADREDALIVSVTEDGTVYFGVNPISPAALPDKVKENLSSRPEMQLYIKADARTPYANVVKVLVAVHAGGVAAPVLLTAQRDPSDVGTLVPPKGLEVLVDPLLPAGSEPTVVQLLNSGQRRPSLQVNNQQIPSASLQSTLKQVFLNRSEKVVLVRAEGTLPFGDVVAVTDICRSTGAKVALITPAL